MEHAIDAFRIGQKVQVNTTGQSMIVAKIGGKDWLTGEKTNLVRVEDHFDPVLDAKEVEENGGNPLYLEHWFEPKYLTPIN